LTALLSLVPVVGSASVWVPWTVYLLVVGSYSRALIFLASQVVIVGGIDNFLRPKLIEGRVGMHTLVVFFSILGESALWRIRNVHRTARVCNGYGLPGVLH
jgi:predicted PurR-regulated permease PerM